jgi:hypothetical protein
MKWRDAAGSALQLDGDPQIAGAFPVWLGFETANGRNAPAPHLSGGPAPDRSNNPKSGSWVIATMGRIGAFDGHEHNSFDAFASPGG